MVAISVFSVTATDARPSMPGTVALTTAIQSPHLHPTPHIKTRPRRTASYNSTILQIYNFTILQFLLMNPNPHLAPLSVVSRASCSTQDTADIAHAMLADLVHSDEDLDDNMGSNSNNGSAYEAASTSRYAAILSAGPGRFWTKRSR